MQKIIHSSEELHSVVDEMIEQNMTQLSLPLYSRKYLCIRVQNAWVSHAASIIQHLQPKKIKGTDCILHKARGNNPPFYVGSFLGSKNIKPTERYVTILVENSMFDSNEYVRREHERYTQGTRYPGDGYLGTIVLSTHTGPYLSDCVFEYYSKVEDYYFDDEVDVVIE